MTNSQIASRRIARSAGWGALGFGIGLALAGSVIGGLAYQTNLFSLGRPLQNALYACAGAIGGAALARGTGPKRHMLLALAGAVGLGLGMALATAIDSGLLGTYVHSYPAMVLALTVQDAALGAWTGLCLGLVQRDPRRTAWLVLAGAVGFAFLYLPYLSDFLNVLEPINALLPFPNASLQHVALVSALQGAAAGIISGGFAGACLGIGNAVPLRANLSRYEPVNQQGII